MKWTSSLKPLAKLTVLTSTVADAFVSNYVRLPAGQALLSRVVSREGGEFLSTTLRRVLKAHYEVSVGLHSYGSLLEPGRADRYTTIGNYVSIGPNVRRFGAAHPLDSGTLHPYSYNPALGYVGREQDVDRTPCEIGHDSWIGANTTILPGCQRIGIGAVIGAGSVVTKDVPDFAVAVGNPAKIVRYRLSDKARAALIESAYWELGPRQMLETVRGIEQMHGG